MKQRLCINYSLLQILIWGLLWGLSEVSIGSLLHTPLLQNYSGWLLYPIGFFCMFKLYNRTGNYYSPLCCGMIAALCKLSTLLVYTPVLLIFVLKPAAFILIESVLTTLVLSAASLWNRKEGTVRI